MLRPQPVEQKPQTIVVVASGLTFAGTWPRPKSPGCKVKSEVRGPVHCRNNEFAGSLVAPGFNVAPDLRDLGASSGFTAESPGRCPKELPSFFTPRLLPAFSPVRPR